MHLGDVLALRAASRVVAERRLVAQRVRAVILREKGVHVMSAQYGWAGLGARATERAR